MSIEIPENLKEEDKKLIQAYNDTNDKIDELFEALEELIDLE